MGRPKGSTNKAKNAIEKLKNKDEESSPNMKLEVVDVNKIKEMLTSNDNKIEDNKNSIEEEKEDKINMIMKIKMSNMQLHKTMLKELEMTNSILEEKMKSLEELIENITKEVKVENPVIPEEITKNINNKPWIRLPYPIREVKIMTYIKEKYGDEGEKKVKEVEEKLLKLLYEKKLTSKTVVYNNVEGKIEEITEY